MINPKAFCDHLFGIGVDFFTGVPDSLLKSFCTHLMTYSEDRHIIAANEGCAIGLATGMYLASGRTPVIYMQNSGIGNATNPLLSLMDSDVYSIPAILLIGWRGEPGTKDEPQHLKQGKITRELLSTMGIENVVMSDNEEELTEQINRCKNHLDVNSSPFAFIIRKGTFSDTVAENDVISNYPSREESIEAIVSTSKGKAIFVSTTGMASRELYEIRERKHQGHEKDFLTVGSMGHASQISLAIAIKKPDVRVFCIDGDGAAIMHMGGMSTIGTVRPKNLVHVVLNNGSHDSVGGQPTVGLMIDLPKTAEAMGYARSYSTDDVSKICEILERNEEGPVFIEMRVRKGARENLGRPRETPKENKMIFMEYVRGL